MLKLKTGSDYINSERKWALDEALAISAGVLLSPAAIGAAALSIADNRGPNILFTQERVGWNGDDFDVWKIRTIREQLTEGKVKLFGSQDPRATRIGSLLRKTGIDEYPQLWDVVTHKQRLLGFRASTEGHLDDLSFANPELFKIWHPLYIEENYGPALTSPGAFMGRLYPERSTETLTAQLEADLAWAPKASWRADMQVLAKAPVDILRSFMVRPPEDSPPSNG